MTQDVYMQVLAVDSLRDLPTTPHNTSNYLFTEPGSQHEHNATGTSADPDCIMFRLVFYTVIIGTLNILGLLGNMLSIMVLQKDQNNRVATFLLQSLAVADSLVLLIMFLVLSVCYGLLPYIGEHELERVLFPHLIKYVSPFGYMAQCGTIWITVLLAFNRFVAIVKPFMAPKYCTLTNARIQVALVALFAFVVNLARFFQYEIIYTSEGNGTYPRINETDIGEGTTFGMVYTNILYTVIVLVVPLIVLTVLNTTLVKELKFPRSQKSSASVISKSSKNSLNSPSSSSKPSFKRRLSFHGPPLPEEDNITFIMIIIIVVLVICHTPDRLFQFYRYFFATAEQVKCGRTLFYLSGVCNLLVVVNSSTNFVVYYMLRKRFRKILVMKICAWRNFQTYKERPSFLEDTKPPLLRRKTEGDMGLPTNGVNHDVIIDVKETTAAMKTGSAPTLC